MTADDPTVSVVIPTYNRATVLDRSIDSVLAQTYTDFELIVVDDGSTDDTRDVIGEFEDERIRYFRHEENEGVSAARNTGIREANGKFIAFQDSDDSWHADKLRKQMQAFEDGSSDVGVVYSGLWRVTDGGRTYVPGSEIQTKEGDIHDALLHGNFVSTQVAVVRTECFEKAGGFDESLPYFEDWELWIRLSKQFEFALVDEPLVTAYLQSDSITNDMEGLVEGRKQLIQKHRDTFDTDTLAEQLFRLGHSSLKTRQANQGRRYLLSATTTKAKPLYLGCLVLSVFGSNVYNKAYDAYAMV